MIKAFAVDDEPAAITTLSLMIERYVPEITTLKTTNRPLEVLEIIESYKPDLVFMDIQMPGLTGFDVLRQLNNIDFEIIFTTAYDQYAIEAIRFSALDYLLKPIDAEELKAAIQRFVKYKTDAEKSRTELYNNLLHNIKTTQSEFKLAVSSSDGIFFFNPNQIIRLEAESNYTRFFFTDKKPLIVAKTLGEYDELLAPHGFLRTHRTHLVNRVYVQSFQPDGYLVMKDNTKVEISRRRKDEVLEILKH
ncbi:MAG: LytTR family DNA-binding domain-containing protein [Bacteroidota bacterium]